MERLCHNCRDIDIRFLVERTSTYPHQRRVRTGSVQNAVQNRDSCDLCFLIAGCIETLSSSWQPPSELDQQQFSISESSERWQRYLDWQHFCRMIRRDPVIARFVDSFRTRAQTNALKVELEGGPLSTEIAEVVDPTWPRPKQQYGQRLLKQKVDISLVRNWRRMCQQQHAERCSHPQWLAMEAPSSLRLIDVKARTVISAPSNSVYASLSYVWGDSSLQVMADLANFDRGYFRLPRLPATIEDAMSITTKLGIAYLWVDALCMAQRPAGNADKEHQLGQMDRIYKSAEITIIAAGCENVADPIPGVRARLHPNKTRNVDGLQLCVSHPVFDEDLFSHTWFQRAWTYQELTLSKRALIFTKHQVYWLCQCDLWCETIVLEPAEPGTPDFVWHPLPDTSKPPKRWLPLVAYDAIREDMDMECIVSEDSLLEAYSNMVIYYTMKRMTHPDDGLNAVAGILSLLQNFDEDRWGAVYCGLPEAFFDGCLLWMPKNVLQRPSDWASQTKIPSWSWAGWFSDIGDGVMWDWLTLSEKFKIIPAIDWYLVDKQQRSIAMRKHMRRREYVDNVEETHQKNPELSLPSGIDHDRMREQPPKLPLSLPPWAGHFLHFLTTISHLYLGRKLEGDDFWASPSGKPHQIHAYTLEDVHGTFVGSMVTPEVLAERYQAPRRPVECIFLSYAREIGAPLFRLRRKHREDLPPEFQVLNERGGRYDSIHIMWISRSPEGYAERVLTGQAMKSCWLATKPRTEWIILG